MINREAADVQKGFRLQKIRAISVMLDLIGRLENPHIYIATEHYEDVYIKNSTPGQEKETFEEDKNYDPTSSFTFNSPVLRNSIVSFVDIWIGKGLGISDSIYFCFYSTNRIAKERTSSLTKKMGISLPEKPILEFLITEEVMDTVSDDVVAIVKAFVLEEYKSQYEGKKNNGHLKVIECWSNKHWRTFLSRIDWVFGQQDEKSLKLEAVEKIKSCKYFSVRHCDGFEDQIFDSLMEIFDSRQHVGDPLEKFVYGTDFRVVFQNIQIKATQNGSFNKMNDPVWKMWDSLPQPTDTRILSEKILEVCPKFSQSAIQNLAVKVTRSYIEAEPVKADKAFLSYRYRIFEKCTDTLHQILSEHDASIPVTEKDVQSWFALLRDSAQRTIQDLSVDYHYRHNNQAMIDGVILELFDTCFLSFSYG